jgi:hypothetical protein
MHRGSERGYFEWCIKGGIGRPGFDMRDPVDGPLAGRPALELPEPEGELTGLHAVRDLAEANGPGSAHAFVILNGSIEDPASERARWTIWQCLTSCPSSAYPPGSLRHFVASLIATGELSRPSDFLRLSDAARKSIVVFMVFSIPITCMSSH